MPSSPAAFLGALPRVSCHIPVIPVLWEAGTLEADTLLSGRAGETHCRGPMPHPQVMGTAVVADLHRLSKCSRQPGQSLLEHRMLGHMDPLCWGLVLRCAVQLLCKLQFGFRFGGAASSSPWSYQGDAAACSTGPKLPKVSVASELSPFPHLSLLETGTEAFVLSYISNPFLDFESLVKLPKLGLKLRSSQLSLPEYQNLVHPFTGLFSGGVAWVECLPCLHKALDLVSSTAKKEPQKCHLTPALWKRGPVQSCSALSVE